MVADVGPPKRVPPLRDRRALVREALHATGYPHGLRLYELLSQRYYWTGMQQDCIEESAGAMPRQFESARFRPPPYLSPSPKGGAPFRLWCLDTITNMVPPAPDGGTSILVCVDPFTRWVEAFPLPHLTSQAVADTFHREIVCRYGLCATVRTDRGVEYAGVFRKYLLAQGVR